MCGQGTQHRTVVCTHDTGVPCDEAQRPASEAACFLPPCLQALDPEGSGSGSFSWKLDTEVSVTHYHLAPHTPSPSPLSNTIEEEEEEEDAAQLGPPGPVFVDDFYYDYNFIRFHEDLSYEPFEEPGPDPAGTGDWTPPPPSGPAEPPAGAPELPRDEDQRAVEDLSPCPGQAGHSTPPPSEQTPRSPLGNLLPEEDPPMEAPDTEPPSLPGPPTSVSEAPAAPGSQDEFLVREQGPSQLPPPRWEVTNEVSEDEEEDPEGRPVPPLPQTPTAASQPEARGWDRSLGPGTPTSPASGLAPPGLHSPAPPETFLGTAPTGPEHRLWGAALSPGPSGQPKTPSPEAPPSLALPFTPATDSLANSSTGPEAQSPDPSPAEEGPPLDLPLARNASWEVGKWSEASTRAIGGPCCLSLPSECWGWAGGPHLPVSLESSEALPWPAQGPQGVRAAPTRHRQGPSSPRLRLKCPKDRALTPDCWASGTVPPLPRPLLPSGAQQGSRGSPGSSACRCGPSTWLSPPSCTQLSLGLQGSERQGTKLPPPKHTRSPIVTAEVSSVQVPSAGVGRTDSLPRWFCPDSWAPQLFPVGRDRGAQGTHRVLGRWVEEPILQMRKPRPWLRRHLLSQRDL